MNPPLLQARGLQKTFRLRSGPLARSVDHVAVDAIDLDLAPRERIGIVGESGSGKSTLGRLLLGLTPPSAGEVRFDGVAHADRRPGDWKAFRRQTSLVQQNPLSALNPQMTIGQQVAEAVWVHRLADRHGARDQAAAMLEKVGLSAELMDRFPHQMSGGQRQRVVIARALVLSPRLVVFDEAVSALDVSVQAQVVAILRSLWQQLDLAYVFITHDLRIVRHLVDRIAVLYLGRVVETGDIRSVYARPRHPYTRALLSSVPSLDPRVRNVAPPVQGDLDPGKAARGCAFRSRCPLAIERCASETPRLRRIDQGHVACHRAEDVRPLPMATAEVA
ncbi:oligopeptide/dipeptide ABC transporter ATP-binding protein [Kaistia adipata]|uniref:oligopeptide/dipeptide ABC transporter ATP-binding protein n=1 Tax=Kaistia adipata TaxID=166954 RepID=UPI0004298864|nr:oligopeptide/dipeptide ABC transporter ATP-binding protein [Kaistia adipata]